MVKEKKQELGTTEEESEEESQSEDSEQEESEQEETEETSEEDVSSQESQKPSDQVYDKKRFDGLMSAWQEDRRARLALEQKVSQIENAQKSAQVNPEDQWLEYIDTKLLERQKKRQQDEEEAARQELERVSSYHSELNREDILNAAIKYKTDLNTAAEFLEDLKNTSRTTKDLTAKELARKARAGKFGGKASGTQSSGLSKYDPKLSFDENFDKGMRELGEKTED